MKTIAMSICTALAALVLMSACAPPANEQGASATPPAAAAPSPAEELAAFKKAIRAQYDLKEKAFADDDADLVVDQFYSDDVFSVDNEGKLHSGRETLRAIYKEVVPPHTVRVESIRSHVDGNSGWDWTNFYVTPDDPEGEAFSFVILFLWENRDGKWWSVGDMYVLGELSAQRNP